MAAKQKAVVDALDAQVKEAYASIKTARSKQQGTDLLVAATKELKLKLKAARAELQTIKKARTKDPALLAKREAINKAAYELRVAETRRSGLYWSNYNNCKQAVDAAKQHPTPPQFKDWDGTGQLEVQLQKGRTVAQLLSGNDSQFQLAPISDAQEGQASGRRAKQRTLIRFRVCSDAKRKPMWAELPMVLHRPLPLDARVMAVRLLRYRNGPSQTLTRNGKLASNWKYKVQFVVESKTFLPTKNLQEASVAIDLGWRGHDSEKEMTGIRVAYWKDSLGAHGELLLSEGLIRRMQHPNIIRGHRDVEFNLAKGFLGEWLSQHDTTAWPSWLRQLSARMVQSRSSTKLKGFVSNWLKHRLEGDTTIVDSLLAWWQHDDHLWAWEAHERDAVLRARKEEFRIFSAQLARTYANIGLEKLSLAPFTRSASPENGSGGVNSSSRHHRTMAAPSELVQSIKAAASKYGAQVEMLPPKNTSRTCHKCLYVDTWNGKKTTEHTCSQCAATWDRDYNAASNLLRILNERLNGAQAA
jgi:hypothetical protein